MLHFELTLVERRLDYQEKNGIRHKKAKETINKGGKEKEIIFNSMNFHYK